MPCFPAEGEWLFYVQFGAKQIESAQLRGLSAAIRLALELSHAEQL